MHRFPTDFSYNPPSVRTDASPTPPPPTDDAIEAIIQQATSARPSERPLRDTRTQLFVGNLPYRVRWQDLKDLFRKAGTVLRADVSLGPDNRSRGYGTVLLATAEDAGRAVDMFNGYSWQTRVLEVRLDRLLPEYEAQVPSVPGSATSSGHLSLPSLSHGSFSSEDQDFSAIYHTSNDPNSCRNLFVGNLPFHCQWQDLKDLFRQAGTILRADVALGPDGRSRGFGTVTFATEYDAERALRMFNGYEYNNRTLKVHFDKHPTGTFTPASSVPPAAGGANAQAHVPHVHNYPSQMQINLPPGYMYDFGPPTGPNSPYEMFSHLQQQQQQQQQAQAQMLQHPQAQHYQKPNMQQRQPNIFGRQSSSLDIDSLTNSLAHTQLSKPVSSTSTTVHKPMSLSTHTSTSSTTGSSSERSLASTSASSVPSPSQASPFSQQQQQPLHQTQKNQQKSKQPQQHPHHPGPISLPPLISTFPISPHTPLAQHGISYSPLHHPSMGSPYQVYHSVHPSAGYQQQSQVSVLTPHGLPPITPSMPPFSFLPTSQANQSPQSQRRRHRNHPSSSSSNASGGTASASSSVRSSSVAPGSSSTPGAQRQPQQPQQPQYQYALPSPQYMIPLPSPGLYLPLPQPSPPVHMRLNLTGIPTIFSPGVAMSPGTFYGRPGDVLPNPNPFINAAVGAPVHVHSPAAHATHGAYFYAMSSPKKGPPSGMEPKGYFDPMYFPPSSGEVGGSGLANEIMRDSASSEGKGKGKEVGADVAERAPSATGTGPSAEAVGNTNTLMKSSLYTKGVGVAEGGATELTQTPEKAEGPLWNEGATISRTHSVGHARKHGSSDSTARGHGSMSRGNSDPIQGGIGHGTSLSSSPSQ